MGAPAYRFVNEIKCLPFVRAVYLFGSRARGHERGRSDIDLAVDMPGASVRQWQQVVDLIENADTLHEVDCVRLDQLPSGGLRDAILNDGRAL